MKRKKRRVMSEVQVVPSPPDPAEVIKAKENVEDRVRLEISRPADGSVLRIYIKAPLVASVVRQMAESNYEAAKYQPIYRPILKLLPANEKLAITRAALARATRHFVGGTDFLWTEPPRSILLANPDALEQGYTLEFKVEAPTPHDLLQKWGKQFMAGCSEIITNAKPFRLAWVMNKT